jgi:hypothetical protein
MIGSEFFAQTVNGYRERSTDEEIPDSNFVCRNTGDQRPVRSGPDRETENPRDVRERLYRSQAQLSWRLFL